MKTEKETEVFVDTTTVIEKKPIICPVVNLLTLEKYKDRKSIANALLDDDFSNPMLAKIAKIIQIKDKQKRQKALNVIQRHCRYSDFKTIKLALDDKGYMYDTRNQIIDWKYVKALALCYDRRVKPSQETEDIQQKKIQSRKKPFRIFWPTRER